MIRSIALAIAAAFAFATSASAINPKPHAEKKAAAGKGKGSGQTRQKKMHDMMMKKGNAKGAAKPTSQSKKPAKKGTALKSTNAEN